MLGGPRLRDEHGAARPLAPHSEADGDAPSDQLPQRSRGSQSGGGERIEKDADRQRPHATDLVSQTAEDNAADRAGDQCNRSEAAHRGAGKREFFLDRNDGEGEEEKIHGVEHPAHLRREQRTPAGTSDGEQRAASGQRDQRRTRANRNISSPRSTGTPPDFRFTSRSASVASARNSASSFSLPAASHFLCSGNGWGF